MDRAVTHASKRPIQCSHSAVFEISELVLSDQGRELRIPVPAMFVVGELAGVVQKLERSIKRVFWTVLRGDTWIATCHEIHGV